MIQDAFGRVHDYLRISLTDNCNLRCFYCMPEESYDFAPAAKLMNAAEIGQIAKLFVAQGVRKIRLTGGEPLIRKDAGKILETLGELPVELVMTTNGTRIHAWIEQLKASGIRSLNVSLDTLQPEKFEMLTRRNLFHQVRSNIELLLHHGFGVRINVVVMRNVNHQEINDFIAWTKHVPVRIRFIEFMPFDKNQWKGEKVFTLREILERIGSEYAVMPVQTDVHDTAKQYMIPGHQGSFAVISTMSAPFCSGCNRMRLTADGKLKNCLFSSTETDLLSQLRQGQDILPLIHECIAGKAEALGGQFSGTFASLDAASLHNRPMITIGG